MPKEHPYAQVRRWVRVQWESRVKVSYRPSDVLQMANGRSQDICEGGIAVYVPIEATIGSTLELEFTVPSSRAPLRLHAVVRNRSGYRYGLEFVVISKAQRDEIATLVNSLSVATSH